MERDAGVPTMRKRLTTVRKRRLRERLRAKLRPYRDAIRWKACGSRSLAEIHEQCRPRFYAESMLVQARDAWLAALPKPVTVEIAPGVYRHTYSFEAPE